MTGRHFADLARRALSRHRPVTWSSESQPTRRDGHYLWIHVADRHYRSAARQLARMIETLEGDLHSFLTDESDPEKDQHPALPEERIADCEAFLSYWHPVAAFWIGGPMRPVLVETAQSLDIAITLIIPPADIVPRRTLFGGQRFVQSLSQMQQIIVDDDAIEQSCKRRGVDADIVKQPSPFEVVGALLPADDDRRDELAASLRGRPIWIAIGIRRDELDQIIAAHRQLTRFSVRAALVIIPRDVADTDYFINRLQSEGLRLLCSESSEMPNEATQVILVDAQTDQGIWYRLAPVAFLGNSMHASFSGQDPYTPAAHGLALLTGPGQSEFKDSCDDFIETGAMRVVNSSDGLAVNLKDLLAPDRAAIMAQAAWDVATKGAPMMDYLLGIAQDIIDEAEFG